MQRLAVRTTILLVMAAGAAVAQPSVFYPAKGQTPERQGQDLAACRSWATQQTGVTQDAPASQPPARVGGRARGAAAGATAAAITGNDAGKGAAAGAVGGAAAQRGARRQDRRQAAAQQQQTSSTFDRAVTACMQGRGYTAQ
ncbi:MAG: glycine zipper family protein [Geminicoccaceae bacterium]